MALSNDLISQFVKNTKDDTKSKTEKTVYGEVVKYNDSTYVKIDGSDLLTPFSTTTDVKDGDRVTLTIKNHTAVVTGNITSPSVNMASTIPNPDGTTTKISEFGIIMADKVNTKELDAETARIDTLYTDVLEVEDGLVAKSAVIEKLQAKDAEFEGELKAKSATIEKLKTEKADITWANIDFANIDKAVLGDLYANSGIIKDVTTETGYVTGSLVGVTINADDITTGTLKADRLVILGEDGIYYKLNYNGGALSGDEVGEKVYHKVEFDTTTGEYTSTEETIEVTEGDIVENAYTQDAKEVYLGTDMNGSEVYYCASINYPEWAYNSLHGSVIVADSITATQVKVSDLVAFDATIAGFHITHDETTRFGTIYSGDKNLENDIKPGIYMDTDGQMNFGDSENYIKYYKDDDGNYKLIISAESIYYALNGTGHSIADLAMLGEYIFIGKQYVKSDETIDAVDGTLLENMLTTTNEPVYLYTDDSGNEEYYCVVNNTTYYKVYAVPCIELGESDSDFKLTISNTQIQFTEGNTIPAYVSNESLHINKAEIEDELRFGQFKWKIRENGNMGLVWEEVTN